MVILFVSIIEIFQFCDDWSYDSVVRSATPTLTLPAEPRNLEKLVGDGKVRLSWDAPTNASQIDKFQIRWKNQPFTDSDTWTDLDKSTRVHLATGLTNKTEYTFAVRAVNSKGDGDVATTTATPDQIPPDKPGDLEAEPSDTEVELSWSIPTNTLDLDGFQVRHKLKSESAWGIGRIYWGQT